MVDKDGAGLVRFGVLLGRRSGRETDGLQALHIDVKDIQALAETAGRKKKGRLRDLPASLT